MPEFSFSRRRFALGAAAATAALALPASAVSRQPIEEQAAGTNPPAPVAATPPTLLEQAQEAFGKLSAAAQAEVEEKYQSILRKYGDKLNAEQKVDVRKSLAETQGGLEALRAFDLKNGDQPAAVFRVYRGEGRK